MQALIALQFAAMKSNRSIKTRGLILEGLESRCLLSGGDKLDSIGPAPAEPAPALLGVVRSSALETGGAAVTPLIEAPDTNAKTVPDNLDHILGSSPSALKTVVDSEDAVSSSPSNFTPDHEASNVEADLLIGASEIEEATSALVVQTTQVVAGRPAVESVSETRTSLSDSNSFLSTSMRLPSRVNAIMGAETIRGFGIPLGNYAAILIADAIVVYPTVAKGAVAGGTVPEAAEAAAHGHDVGSNPEATADALRGSSARDADLAASLVRNNLEALDHAIDRLFANSEVSILESAGAGFSENWIPSLFAAGCGLTLAESLRRRIRRTREESAYTPEDDDPLVPGALHWAGEDG